MLVHPSNALPIRQRQAMVGELPTIDLHQPRVEIDAGSVQGAGRGDCVLFGRIVPGTASQGR